MISKLRPEITIARTDRGGLTPFFKSAATLRRASVGAGPSGEQTKAPRPDVGLVGKRCQASALQGAMRASQGRRLVYHFP